MSRHCYHYLASHMHTRTRTQAHSYIQTLYTHAIHDHTHAGTNTLISTHKFTDTYTLTLTHKHRHLIPPKVMLFRSTTIRLGTLVFRDCPNRNCGRHYVSATFLLLSMLVFLMLLRLAIYSCCGCRVIRYLHVRIAWQILVDQRVAVGCWLNHPCRTSLCSDGIVDVRVLSRLSMRLSSILSTMLNPPGEPCMHAGTARTAAAAVHAAGPPTAASSR